MTKIIVSGSLTYTVEPLQRGWASVFVTSGGVEQDIFQAHFVVPRQTLSRRTFPFNVTVEIIGSDPEFTSRASVPELDPRIELSRFTSNVSHEIFDVTVISEPDPILQMAEQEEILPTINAGEQSKEDFTTITQQEQIGFVTAVCTPERPCPPEGERRFLTTEQQLAIINDPDLTQGQKEQSLGVLALLAVLALG